MLVAAGLWWETFRQQSVTAEHSNVNRIQAHDQEVPASSDNSQPGTMILQQEDVPALIISSEMSSLTLSSSLRNNRHDQHALADNQTYPVTSPETGSALTSGHVSKQENRGIQSKISEQNATGGKVLQYESKVNPALPKSPSSASVGPDNTISGPPASVTKLPGSVDKQIKQLSLQQQADNEFRKANILMQQGRVGDAISEYAAALQLDSGHEDARQAMVSLLLDRKRNADAEGALEEGLNLNPKQVGFAKLLARLQVDRGALPQALETLQKTLPYAGRQADFQAFIAAVQQRMGHHKEAVVHYSVALQSSPDSGVWLMGLGISLKALEQHEEALVAFKHALESHTLNEELQAFVTQQIKEL